VRISARGQNRNLLQSSDGDDLSPDKLSRAV
jgi:hypothetical protein